MVRRAFRGAMLFAVGCGTALPVAAQVAPQVPPPLPSRQEVTPPTPEPPKEAAPRIDASGALAVPNCPFETSTLRLTITRLDITRPDGSPLQPQIAAALAKVVAPTGEQPLRTVCEIRDAANAALRREGWIASVQIPEQEIADGVLKLQVVTAHIVEMHVRGDAGRYEAILRRRLAAIQALDPLNEREAERLLLLAGDIPGLDVALALRPAGGVQGAVIGELSVSSRRFAIFGNEQNYNSKLLGRGTFYARGEIYGLTGLSDLTYFGASSTTDFQEQIVAQGGHIFGLDDAGTTLGIRGTYAWSRPDLGPLDLRTDTLIMGVDLVHPLIRTVRSNARVRGGFDFVNQTTNVGGGRDAVTLSRDHLRIAYVGVDADYSGLRANGSPLFSLSGSLELRKGLGIFDSSDIGFLSGTQTSRQEGNSRAFVIRGVLDGTLYLNRIFSIEAQGQVQWANDPLLNYEEFALGSLTLGRGYDPGSNSGDRAVGGHVELRADVPLTEQFGTQFYGFYDHLYLRNLDITAIEGPRNFGSVGGGVRFSLRNHMVLDVGYAKPLDKALLLDTRKPPARVLVSLTVQFRDSAR
jgi:hemolysin activation/secretion protein